MSHEEINRCPVCQLQHQEFRYKRITQSMTYDVYCPRCSNYITSYEFLLFNEGLQERHLLSGLIRELNYEKVIPEIFVKDMESLFSNSLIPKDNDIEAKKDKLLVSLRRLSDHLGDLITVDSQLDISIAYARNSRELMALIQALRNDNLLSGQRIIYSLTEQGWKKAELLIAQQKNKAPSPKTPILSIENNVEIPEDPIEIPLDQEDEEYAPDKSLCDLFQSLQFHPEIVRVSWRAFKHGLFAEAIENAFKEINVAVKKKANCSGKNDHSLMAKVFDEAAPILRLNDLADETQESEQIGFKLLFMGATTGIRNPKAHTNVIQKDPHKTLHYLSFASLLMKMVDDSILVSEKQPDKEKKV